MRHGGMIDGRRWVLWGLAESHEDLSMRQLSLARQHGRANAYYYYNSAGTTRSSTCGTCREIAAHKLQQRLGFPSVNLEALARLPSSIGHG